MRTQSKRKKENKAKTPQRNPAKHNYHRTEHGRESKHHNNKRNNRMKMNGKKREKRIEYYEKNSEKKRGEIWN